MLGVVDRVDDGRVAASVLRAVARVDLAEDCLIGVLDGHVLRHAAGADLSATAGARHAVPAAARAVRRTDVQVAAHLYDPDRRRAAQFAVTADRCEVELFRGGDAMQLLVAPAGHHRLPTRTSDLMARRSSMAAYASAMPSRSVS